MIKTIRRSMDCVSFTRRGWVDAKGNMPFAVMESDGNGHIRYSLDFRQCPKRTSCFYPESSPLPMPHEDEVSSLLLGIALGQRQNTPITQNKFIGRNNKTFFSGRARIAYTHRQDHVLNISALANYVNATSRDRDCGTVERVYEEYCFVVGNLAYTLMMTVKRLNDASCNEASSKGKQAKHLQSKRYADPSKTKMPVMSFDKRTLKALTKLLSDDATAVKLVHGIMLCCYVRDHTSIEKDKKSVKLRNAVRKFANAMQRAEEVFSSKEAKDLRLDGKLCKIFIAMSDTSDDVVYIVRDGTDDVVNWLDEAYSDMRKSNWLERYPDQGSSDDIKDEKRKIPKRKTAKEQIRRQQRK